MILQIEKVKCDYHQPETNWNGFGHVNKLKESELQNQRLKILNIH